MPSLADTFDSIPTTTPFVGPIARAGETASNIYDQVSSGERVDVPTATGEDEWFDTGYDTIVEQPDWAEDDEDVPGPSLGELTDGLGLTDGVDPNEGDPGLKEFVDGLRNAGPDWLDEVTGVVLLLVVFGAIVWLVRPLLGIIEGVVTET